MAVEKIVVPDFGDVQEITVVEVFIAVGDSVAEEDSVIALESEKAVMDIPSPLTGKIAEILVTEDQVVKSGDVIAMIEVSEEGTADGEDTPEAKEEVEEKVEEAVASTEGPVEAPDAQSAALSAAAPPPVNRQEPGAMVHATPSLRALARERGIDLTTIKGSGPLGRILDGDLPGAGAAPGGASSLFDPVPLEDFSKYGEVEEVPLGRIQKRSGPHLHKSWVAIPHVTHFDEADMTELDSFRKELNKNKAEDEPSLSPLVFVIAAVAAALKAFPAFNSSLDVGKNLILKKYYNIGIAVDTPDGLVVPVIKDADRKGVKELALELQKLSGNARAGALAITDMQGATFTISSLGGIGGTGFTPIVSSPQVGILGLSRSYIKPVWNGDEFVPRLILPFSVSYDHRVIDGAEAARFCKDLRLNIEDLRRTLL